MSAKLTLVAYAAVGGALGTAARYLLTVFVQSRAGAGFPWGTLLVNVSGSILLGFLMRYSLESTTASPEIRFLLTTGFCGGYTTFSTFSYETSRLIEDGEWSRGVAYIAASVLASLGGIFIGFALARGLHAVQRS